MTQALLAWRVSFNTMVLWPQSTEFSSVNNFWCEKLPYQGGNLVPILGGKNGANTLIASETK
jgi:hypothetical protein